MQQIAIEDELTIYMAAELKPKLVGMLALDDEIELDLSQVQEIDTAGLQLLILLKREAADAGKTLRFVMHSPAVLEVLELTNLTASFGDQVVLAHEQG